MLNTVDLSKTCTNNSIFNSSDCRLSCKHIINRNAYICTVTHNNLDLIIHTDKNDSIQYTYYKINTNKFMPEEFLSDQDIDKSKLSF